MRPFVVDQCNGANKAVITVQETKNILTSTTHTSEVTAIQGLARVVFHMTLNI